MDNEPKIDVPHEKVAEFCRRHHIRRLSFFGSVPRANFGPESDVDVLVEFEPGMGSGFLGLSHMELELSKLLGRKADLSTPNELRWYFRDEVVSSARTGYAEG